MPRNAHGRLAATVGLACRLSSPMRFRAGMERRTLGTASSKKRLLSHMVKAGGVLSLHDFRSDDRLRETVATLLNVFPVSADV